MLKTTKYTESAVESKKTKNKNSGNIMVDNSEDINKKSSTKKKINLKWLI